MITLIKIAIFCGPASQGHNYGAMDVVSRTAGRRSASGNGLVIVMASGDGDNAIVRVGEIELLGVISPVRVQPYPSSSSPVATVCPHPVFYDHAILRPFFAPCTRVLAKHRWSFLFDPRLHSIPWYGSEDCPEDCRLFNSFYKRTGLAALLPASVTSATAFNTLHKDMKIFMSLLMSMSKTGCSKNC